MEPLVGLGWGVWTWSLPLIVPSYQTRKEATRVGVAPRIVCEELGGNPADGEPEAGSPGTGRRGRNECRLLQPSRRAVSGWRSSSLRKVLGQPWGPAHRPGRAGCTSSCPCAAAAQRGMGPDEVSKPRQLSHPPISHFVVETLWEQSQACPQVRGRGAGQIPGSCCSLIETLRSGIPNPLAFCRKGWCTLFQTRTLTLLTLNSSPHV